MIDETCPLCRSENTREDADFPDTMRNCNECGAEWNEDEVTLDPAKID